MKGRWHQVGVAGAEVSLEQQKNGGAGAGVGLWAPPCAS